MNRRKGHGVFFVLLGVFLGLAGYKYLDPQKKAEALYGSQAVVATMQKDRLAAITDPQYPLTPYHRKLVCGPVPTTPADVENILGLQGARGDFPQWWVIWPFIDVQKQQGMNLQERGWILPLNVETMRKKICAH